MGYIYSLPLMPAVILSFLSSQVASLMQSYKNHELYFTGMIPVVLWYLNARSYVDLELPLPPLNFLRSFLSFTLFPNKNARIYIETAIVVVISYMSLLIVNWSYIWLVVFPVIGIGFIAALCRELSHQSSGSRRQSDDGEAGAGKKLAEGLEAAALVPYWALCVMGQLHADKFAVSQFLLFFSFMLGALTMMMSRLALTGAADRGVAPASKLLRKASLVVLLVAVHAVAAELLGENLLLFCLPEIAPVLLWFSVRLDGDGGAGIIAAAEIKLEGRVLAVLGAAPASALALLANYMDESVLFYWITKALVSCGISGLLVYYLVFLLCQWPGQDGTTTPFGKEAARLLMFWANVLLTAASTLLFTFLLVAALVVLQEPMAAASGRQILQRICEKFLEFIV